MDEAQEQESANAILVFFMARVADVLAPSFPLHAAALRGEIVGTKLTTDRWNRVAFVLASLYSVPGFPLKPHEHAVRNFALAAVVVASKIAAASFGGKDPAGYREFALWRANELSNEISLLTV